MDTFKAAETKNQYLKYVFWC